MNIHFSYKIPNLPSLYMIPFSIIAKENTLKYSPYLFPVRWVVLGKMLFESWLAATTFSLLSLSRIAPTCKSRRGLGMAMRRGGDRHPCTHPRYSTYIPVLSPSPLELPKGISVPSSNNKRGSPRDPQFLNN